MVKSSMDIVSIKTRFTEQYGLKHPLACAGLAFAGTTAPLAIAVAQSGAMGAVGIGKMPAPYINVVLDEIRAATDGAINLNFITIFTEESHIDASVELCPAVVSFHWGHPSKAWIQKLQDAGIKVWEQVGSVEAAKLAAVDGIDLIIVQGSEAGGHNYGTLPLSVLLPAIIDAVAPTMVLAAGGIVDGRGVASALALGADGVWVGTRMIATEEADIAADYKALILSAKGEDTTLSSIFGADIEGFNPMRVLRNDIVREWEGRESEAPIDSSTEPVLGTMHLAGMELPLHRFSNLLPMSNATGNVNQMPLLSGQGVGLINNIAPAHEVIGEMMSTAQSILKHLGQATQP